MEKRLRLAKRLLSDVGVLIVTIDEHEVNHLGVLLEQLFPSYLRHLVTIVHNPKGTYKKNFARVEEYAFFCVPNTAEDVIQTMPRGMFAKVASPDQIATASDDDDNDPPFEDLYLRRRGQESSYRTQRPNQFYAILVDEETREVVGVGPELSEDDEYEITRDGSIVTVYPLDTRGEERAWRYYQPTMIDYIEKGQIVVTGKTSRAKQGWVLNHRVPQKTDKRLKTVWWEKRHDAGMHGSELLTEYLGSSGNFPFPKSVYAVSDCIEAVVKDKPDAIIVDCFAGSGTTFHATCLINAKDGGTRRSILVSNNEVDSKSEKRLRKSGLRPGDAEYEKHGIYESVTRKRVEAVVSGLRPDGTPVPGEHVWADRRKYADGFPENVAFYRLDYLDPDDVELGLQADAIIPALWLMAGGVGEPELGVSDQDYSIPEGSTYAILFRASRYLAFKEAVTAHPKLTHVWIVTDSEAAFSEMRAGLSPDLQVSMLYRDYLQNFRIHTARPR